MSPEFRKKFMQAVEHKMKGEWDQYHVLMDELLIMMSVKP